mgnify:CR=1 FL=1|jgi:hypothetical protein
MNYDKLVRKLRAKAFDYKDAKDIQFDRILKEAVQRKVKQYKQTDEYKRRYSMRQNRLLFQTR